MAVQLNVRLAGFVPVTVPPTHPVTVAVAVAGVNCATSGGVPPLVTVSGPVKLEIAGCVTTAMSLFVADKPAALVTVIVTVVDALGFDARCVVNDPVYEPVSGVAAIAGLNVTVHPAQPWPEKFAVAPGAIEPPVNVSDVLVGSGAIWTA
jgi:hypothetical protein